MRGLATASLCVWIACGPSAAPPMVPAPAPKVARVAPASCKQITTLAAYLGEHVEKNNEGATDRPFDPVIDADPEQAQAREKAERDAEAARRAADPFDGHTLGDPTCTLVGKDAINPYRMLVALGNAMNAIMATPKATAPAKSAAVKPAIDRLALVDASLHLSQAESAKLAATGLVALDRFDFADYATAFYEVYRRDLPLYVGIDPILHAHHVAHDSFVADIEKSRLVATTKYLLEAMACALPAYADSVSADTARDLDLYLGVARELITDENVASALGDAETERTVRELAARARVGKAMEPVTLFGRERMVDWSQFVPRGHYAPEDGSRGKRGARPGGEDPFASYFRALVWLSRIELDLGGDTTCAAAAIGPGPADRDTLLAFALVDLVKAAGAEDALADLDRTWSALAGAPEAVRFGALADVRAAVNVSLTDPKAAAKLRAVTGEKFLRSVPTGYTAPACAGALPAVTSLIAPRVGLDARGMRPLGREDEVADAAGLAYMLGHDVVAQPTRGQQGARLMMGEVRTRTSPSGSPTEAYGAWLEAVLAIADPPSGVVPASLASPAGRARRAESAVVGYAQLRSSNISLSAQTYDEDACSIPDAYLEPLPAVYEKLAVLADRSAELAQDHAMPLWADHFKRMARIDRVLAKIAEHELSGAPLTADMQRFLGMVVEIHTDVGYAGMPMFAGWYFNLFRHLERDAFHPAGFEAEVFTHTKAQTVTTIGAAAPVLGAVVIDTNGARRVVVGPISRAIGGVTELSEHDARDRGPRDRGPGDRRPRPRHRARVFDEVPWRAAYAVETPSLYAKITARFEHPPEHAKKTVVVDIQNTAPAAYVIELLGANRKVVATKKVPHTEEGVNETTFPMPKVLSAIHVSQGESHAWLSCHTDPDTGPECETHYLEDPSMPSKRPDRREPD